MTSLPPSPAIASTGTDHRAPRRPRAGQRARWLAARTRNAARHGLLIASAGTVVVITALLLFVIVPRQVDRVLAAQIAALPAERDTIALQAERVAARNELSRLDALLASAAIATRAAAPVALDSTAPGAVPGTVPGAVPGAVPSALPNAPAAAQPMRVATATIAPPRDSAILELREQLARVRQAPLVESYRALADSRLLRDDLRVRSMIDSIEQLHAEREAYAALNGPDARYAAMTTRLTQLGQRLTGRAESTYASANATANATANAKAGVNVSAVPTGAAVAVDSLQAAPLLVVQQPLADSALERSRDVADSAVQRIERSFAEAIAINTEIRAKREALRSRLQIDVPPMAMLLASLVLGLVLGFTFALGREMRRPTVGDEQELEQLTRTRVIVHRAPTASVRAARARRRADDALPPIMQPTDAAWPLLHLTLSSIGDVSRHVEIVADPPVLAGAVALNLAAVAAHESRATVLVDAASRTSGLVTLLPTSVLTTASTSTAGRSKGPSGDAGSSRWEAPRSFAIGRDMFIDVVLPRQLRSRHDHGALDDVAFADELRGLAAHHDLAVYVTDHDLDRQVPGETDVVLCARPGVTTLAWLARVTRQLQDRGRRVRAVVLWSDDLPAA